MENDDDDDIWKTRECMFTYTIFTPSLMLFLFSNNNRNNVIELFTVWQEKNTNFPCYSPFLLNWTQYLSLSLCHLLTVILCVYTIYGDDYERRRRKPHKWCQHQKIARKYLSINITMLSYRNTMHCERKEADTNWAKKSKMIWTTNDNR